MKTGIPTKQVRMEHSLRPTREYRRFPDAQRAKNGMVTPEFGIASGHSTISDGLYPTIEKLGMTCEHCRSDPHAKLSYDQLNDGNTDDAVLIIEYKGRTSSTQSKKEHSLRPIQKHRRFPDIHCAKNRSATPKLA